MSTSILDLESIGVRFATFRDQSSEERAATAATLRDATADERVLIETCHRVELVTVGGAEPGSLRGRDAVKRVFEVVAGFDSAVVAEEQLIGQVRAAYESALAGGTTGPVLNELFRRALRFGRRVRASATPGTDRGLADPGLAWLHERLPAGGLVAVVGGGEMGRLLARRLADAGCRVVAISRDADRGRRLVDGLPGHGHQLVIGQLPAEVVRTVDGVVVAVRAGSPVLDAAKLGQARPWTLDLSAPPAVAPDAIGVLGDRLLALDGLAPRPDAVPVLDPATERRLHGELADEVHRFATWLTARHGRDALAVLHAEADAVRDRHLARLRGRAGLDEAQLAAVEAATAAMLGELLHGPTLELRRGGADAAAVRRLFGLGG